MKVDLCKEARGRECTVRLAGVCNRDPSTSVLAHLNVPGIAQKAHDLHAAIACSACHDWLDRGYVFSVGKHGRDYEHLRAVIRTQKIWLEEGFIHLEK